MNSGASLYHLRSTRARAHRRGRSAGEQQPARASGTYTDMGVANVLIFCDTSAGGGKLRIYNSSGAVFYTPTVFVSATQDLGKR